MPVLQFKGKTAIESFHHTVQHHTLKFDNKLSVLGKGEKLGLDGNLIIEGDNLIALKALLPTHAGRIKCIYIDHPYNTGNEGGVIMTILAIRSSRSGLVKPWEKKRKMPRVMMKGS